MLYVDYNFFITEAGLTMSDTHPDEMIAIERTPFKVGDVFVLTQTAEGALYFRRTESMQNQLEFDYGN